MTVLVVGSVALDSVETPFGRATDVLGGSGTFFSAAASLFAPVQLVGVVGSDYPVEKLEPLAKRGVDLAGLEARLDPTHFIRIHRSTILRRDCIRGLRHDGLGVWSIELEDGSALRIGRTYLAKVKAMAGR